MGRFFPVLVVSLIVSGQPFADFFVSNDANYSAQGAVSQVRFFSVSLNGTFGRLAGVEGISARITLGSTTVNAKILSNDLVRFRALLHTSGRGRDERYSQWTDI
jgi:hypothetical protein